MTLKGVHIVFLILASLSSAWLGAWAWQGYRLMESSIYLLIALASIAIAVVLAVYAYIFNQKLRN